MIQTLIKIVLPIFILHSTNLLIGETLAIQLLVGWAFCVFISYLHSFISLATSSKKIAKFIFSKYTASIQLALTQLFKNSKMVFSLGLRLPVYSINPFEEQKAYFNNNYYQS